MTIYVILRGVRENDEAPWAYAPVHTSTDVPGSEAACYEYLDTLPSSEGQQGVRLATVPLRSWEPATHKGKWSWSRETVKDGTPTADDELSMGTLPSVEPSQAPGTDDDLPLGPPHLQPGLEPQPSLLDAPPPGGDMFPPSDEEAPPVAAAMFDDTLDS